MTAPTAEKVNQAIDHMLAIYSDPARWTQGTTARDQGGEPCHHGSPTASSFCMLGCALKAVHTIDPLLGFDTDGLYEAIAKRLTETAPMIPPVTIFSGTTMIAAINDNKQMTYDKIVEWLKAAKTGSGDVQL